MANDKNRKRVLGEAFRGISLAAEEGRILAREDLTPSNFNRIREQAQNAKLLAEAVLESCDLAQAASAILERVGS